MRRSLLLLTVLALAAAVEAQPVASPNPVGDGPLTVRHGLEAPSFELFDLLGRRLDPASTLPAGVYLWRLRAEDGTATAAQRVTRLSSGALDVRLVRDRGFEARAAEAPLAAEAAAGCRNSAPVFGGFQHNAYKGATVAAGATLAVTREGQWAAVRSCLGAVGGVGGSYLDSSSPYVVGTDAFLASAVGTEGASMNLRLNTAGNGTVADLRAGLAPNRPRLVEVLDVTPAGDLEVVASTVVPAGTPLGERLVRVGAGGAPFELGGLAVVTHAEGNPEQFGADQPVVTAVVGFRTGGSGRVDVRLGASTVQGVAVAVTTPTTTRIMFETLLQQSTGAGFEVADVAFVTYGAETSLFAPAAAAVDAATPWLRAPTATTLYSTSGAGTEVQVGCARGATCATYGVEASPGLVGTLYGGDLQASRPPGDGVVVGGLRARSGRGLLFSQGEDVEVTGYYRYELANAAPGAAPSVGGAAVTLSTPVTRSLVVRADDVGDAPTIESAVVRYVRDGQVVIEKPLPLGQDVDLGLRVELSDAFVSFGAETSLFAPSAGAPPPIVYRFTDALRDGGEVHVLLTTGPPVSDYLTITMERLQPWSFGYIAADAGTSPL